MSISVLSDTQLVLLSRASQRESGSLVPFSKSLKSGEADIKDAISDLLVRGLVSESEVTRANQAWRQTEEGRIGVIVTPAGLEAIAVENDSEGSGIPPELTPTSAAPASREIAAAARAGTKTALLIDMLRQSNGATIDEIVAATGWLSHTARAALTCLRKRGHHVSNEKVAGARRYCIVGVVK